MNASFVLATIVMEAAGIREQSFDHAKANELSKGYVMPDFETCYAVSLRDACMQACEKHNQPELAEMVCSMLDRTWNFSIEWAGNVLTKHKEAKA